VVVEDNQEEDNNQELGAGHHKEGEEV